MKCTLSSKATISYKTMNTQMNYQSEMTSQIDESLSLYIPHVFPNFDKEYVAGVFEDMEFGIVDHVDLVAKMDKNGKPYNAAYIHFSEWFNTTSVANFQERVVDPTREARIVHDDPWFWIVLENKATKYEPGARKPTLDLSDPGAEEFYDVEYEDEEDEEEDITKIPIAPGVSQLILSQKMLKEFDEIVDEIYKDPKYAVEVKEVEYKEDEVTRLKAENQLLRSTIAMHANHANERNSTIESLKLDIGYLNRVLNDHIKLLQEADDYIHKERDENLDKIQDLEEMLDEERQENFAKLQDLEEMLDEERQDSFLRLQEAQELLDQERMGNMLIEETNKENTRNLLMSILNSGSLDEAREKANNYLLNNNV